jgi:protein TonB
VIVPGLPAIDVPDPSVGGPPLDASSLLGSEAPSGGSDPYHGADGAANGAAGNGGAWAGAAVEIEARLLDGSVAPRYPAALERSGGAGRVLARFVVDARGRVEPRTVVIVATDHELFTAAVRRALAAYRFAPARVGGRAVRQLVEMPFVFEVRR